MNQHYHELSVIIAVGYGIAIPLGKLTALDICQFLIRFFNTLKNLGTIFKL